MTRIVRNICAFAPDPIDPAADWIEIMPVGEFRTADGRGATPFRLDPADVAAVIARSMAMASNGELLIDFDHRSMADQTIADTRAAGWIKDLRLEGDRVMASVVWTPDGRAALEGRSYRFISPVFDNLKGDGRVVRIQGAALVNDPALPQLRQLASRDNSSMEPIEQIAGLLGLPADQPEDIVARVSALATAETQLASITRAAGATGDDAVVQICAKLAERAPDPAAFVPMATFQEVQTQLAALQKDISRDKVEAALERARDAGKLVPAMEEWATQLASKDLASFEGWAAAAPVMAPLGARQVAGRVPPASKPDQLTEVERQAASRLGISAEAMLATRSAETKEI